jgi:hypothetical protein
LTSQFSAKEVDMGWLKGILGGFMGAGALSLVKEYLEKHGGIQGVVAEFEKTGFGQQAKSWVSTGPNLPITAEQIRQALGSGKSEGTGRQIRPARRQGRGSAGQAPAHRHRQGNPGRQAAAAGVSNLVHLPGLDSSGRCALGTVDIHFNAMTAAGEVDHGGKALICLVVSCCAPHDWKAPLKDPTAVRAALTITISSGIGVAS